MSGIKHLSMRVPWRDRPWGQVKSRDVVYDVVV